MKMNIYAAEAKIEGLAEKIIANQSIAYTTPVEIWTPNEREKVQKQILLDRFSASATVHGLSVGSSLDKDLYPTKSILVSTNWNLNDDVFGPAPVWAARHTPSHKPTNLDHDETRLVGHITESWALDDDGNIIKDDTAVDELPDLYHIANGAVIYTNWEDDSLVQRTNELIEQIKAGTKFVSMEALFSDFAYAIMTPEKKYHIVARNGDTAFLTRHLRCYGGTGQFDGCKIGRLLQNITFSGKGYVDKPANPFSIIFKSENSFNYSKASLENPFNTESGVSINYSTTSSEDKKAESKQMTTENTSVDILKADKEASDAKIAKLEAKIEELSKANSEAGVKALEASVAELTAKLDTVKAELEEAKQSVATLTTEKEALSTELSTANEAKTQLEEKVKAAEVAKKRSDRVSHLVDAGVDKGVAEKKVDVYANLSDEQFESIAADIIAAFPPKKDDEKKDDKKDDKKDAKADVDEDDADADTKVLDDADASDDDADLSADADETEDKEEETLAKELADMLDARSGKVSQKD